MGKIPKIIAMEAYSTFATLLLIALLTALSQELDSYTCDNIYDDTCVIIGIDDLNRWEFDLRAPGQIHGMKFTSSHFEKLTSKVVVHKDSFIVSIDLRGNHIKIVEKFSFNIEYLWAANLSRNEIGNLDSSSIFEANKHLETIDLSFNRITSIVSDAFVGSSELKILYLNDNQLKVIAELVFAPLVQLTSLELSGNLIEKFENNPFVELVRLRKIRLERNNFSEFNFNILEPKKYLREISLGDNSGHDFLSLIGNINSTDANVKLSRVMMQSNTTVAVRSVSLKNSKLSELVIPTVVESVVATNSSITKLHINGNNSSLQRGDFSRNSLTGQLSFENCRQLTILDLSFNRIQSLTFPNQSLITNLHLSNNNLTQIHQTMTNLTKLQILDLSFNCIENFEMSTFLNMKLLRVLNLRQSCFKSLDYGTFSFQVNLRVLDISFNNLNNVNLDLLTAQDKLEDLFIDGNNLTNVQSIDSIEIYFPSLRSIGLTHNNWSCKTLSNMINKLLRTNIKPFVETSISHTTNVRGIGCTTTNSSHETLIVPDNSMPIDHTAYMSKIENINAIVETVNKLNDSRNYRESLANAFGDVQREKFQFQSDFNEKINQLKTFGRGVVHKFKTLNDDNLQTLMKMKAKIAQLNQTNNEKHDLIVESIKSLKDKLKLLQSNEENSSENRIVAKDKFTRESDRRRDDLELLGALETTLIVSLFVLILVALYYVYVYC